VSLVAVAVEIARHAAADHAVAVQVLGRVARLGGVRVHVGIVVVAVVALRRRRVAVAVLVDDAGGVGAVVAALVDAVAAALRRAQEHVAHALGGEAAGFAGRVQEVGGGVGGVLLAEVLAA